MLEVRNITKVFNRGTINEKVALCDVSFKLKKGEFVTLIGSNGSGKSTLLNCIAGVFQVDSGSIIIDGIDITKLCEYKRASMISRVFQDPMMGTASDMEIEENLALALRRGKRRGLRWGINNDEREYYKKLLKRLGLGLENRISAKVGLLSGGERQAITLLMAIIKKPKLLLLDEHAAALDPGTAKKVMDLTDRIVMENNLTTLMVTHNMRDAIKHGNRLMMMYEGKVILDIKDEEKKKLTVEDLINRFESVSGEEFADDRALLS
ncbi:MAG: ATP-binding cassette domain-containing protein [Actinobacteria bacterium]|nr:ATP-binding cassette domain-containing protein [Actinomycetota bacterium]